MCDSVWVKQEGEDMRKRNLRVRLLAGIMAAVTMTASVPGRVYASEMTEQPRREEEILKENILAGEEAEADTVQEEMQDGSKEKEETTGETEGISENDCEQEKGDETSSDKDDVEDSNASGAEQSPDEGEMSEENRNNGTDHPDDEIIPDDDGAAEVYGNTSVYAASGNGVIDKLNELKNTYPDGKYWRRVNGENTVCDTACPTHGNLNTCGFYNGGYQCWAFASKIFCEIFGQNPNIGGGKRYDKDNIRVGDYVRFAENANSSYGHSFVVLSVLGNGRVTVVENNYGTGRCRIRWEREVDMNGTMKTYNQNGQLVDAKFVYYCRATNYDEIANASPKPAVGSDMPAPFIRTIADGDYHIVTGLDDHMCLDIEHISTENGANAHIHHTTEHENQVFTVTWLGENKGYKIIHRYSGKSLDVEGASKEEGANVWQWEYYDPDTHTQNWVINETDHGAYYTIQSRGSGFYLDVDDGIAEDGRNVKIWTGNEGAAQKWRFIPAGEQTIPDGDYHIMTSLDDHMCLDIQGTSAEDEANVVLSHKTGQESQIFTVKYLDYGFYKILNKKSGKSLDVYGGLAERGTNVQQFNDHGGYSQQWTIRDTGSGSYYIQPRCSGHYMDAANGSTADGTNVWTTVWMGGAAAQQWKFEPAEKIKLDPPGASIPSGTEVESGTEVMLFCSEEGASIYYTLDGTVPSLQSICYDGPVTIEKDTVISAYAVKEGCEDSEPVSFSYTVLKKPDEGQGDVLDEDIPQGNVDNIPQGLWMSKVASQVYTGRPVKPEVRVYDHKTLLTEKKDYTITYKNNTKANAASGTSAPTITVTGKGNYTGKDMQTFVIRQKTISDGDVAAEHMTVQYTGKVQKPLPAVVWNGKKLVRNRDYTISYPDEELDGAANPGAYIKPGTYTILLHGRGNYTGEKRIELTITMSKPVSGLTVAKIPNQIYTGEELMPVPVVKDKKTVLTEGVDYEVSYQNHVGVGSASVMITGKGDYAGVKRTTFKILPRASLNKAQVQMEFDGSVVYTGAEIIPDSITLTVSAKKPDGNFITETLKENVDYEVTYRNNSKAGTATAIFQGINGYTGTLKKSYKIEPYDIGREENGAKPEQKIEIKLAETCGYRKGGCKPKPEVLFQGKALKEGTDYTLSYRNNTSLNDGSGETNANKRPAVIIKGKGCFKGVREMTYTIVPGELGGLDITAADRVWQNKGDIYRTKVTIKDENGKTLSAGKDYDKRFRYEYAEDTVLSDGSIRKAGEEIGASDIIPAGTRLRVTVTAKGRYYTGTVSGIYRIARADLGKAKVTIPAQIYTGREIRPESEIQVKLNGQILDQDNYEITGYSNNINKGTATVTIKGKNDCGGVKTAGFKIKGKGFLWWWR